ncbi:MAG: hypothetical protein WDM89_12150 [Rhizomicrobium sp.]
MDVSGLQEELDRLSRILRQKSDEIEALRGADHERQQVHDELDRLNPHFAGEKQRD